MKGSLDVYGPELSGVSGEVTFPQVKKPSDAAGFFSIGVKEVAVHFPRTLRVPAGGQ